MARKQTARKSVLPVARSGMETKTSQPLRTVGGGSLGAAAAAAIAPPVVAGCSPKAGGKETPNRKPLTPKAREKQYKLRLREAEDDPDCRAKYRFENGKLYVDWIIQKDEKMPSRGKEFPLPPDSSGLEASAFVCAYAKAYPLRNKDGDIVTFPCTDEPVMDPSAYAYLLQYNPRLFEPRFAGEELARHAMRNGLARTLDPLLVETLHPSSKLASVRSVGSCVRCCAHPAQGGDPPHPLEFATFNSFVQLSQARAERQAKFAEHEDGTTPDRANPLCPAWGTRPPDKCLQCCNAAEFMQSLVVLRENTSVHNQLTLDPEQRKLNGDLVNICGSLISGLDGVFRRLTEDLPEEGENQAVFEGYKVAAEYLWSHGSTDLCHPWPDELVMSPPSLATLRQKAGVAPRGSRTSTSLKTSSSTPGNGKKRASQEGGGPSAKKTKVQE